MLDCVVVACGANPVNQTFCPTTTPSDATVASNVILLLEIVVAVEVIFAGNDVNTIGMLTNMPSLPDTVIKFVLVATPVTGIDIPLAVIFVVRPSPP